MPEGDPIDELYVRLTGDASDFIEVFERAVKIAQDTMDEGIKEIGRSWEEIWKDADVTRMGEIVEESLAKIKGMFEAVGMVFDEAAITKYTAQFEEAVKGFQFLGLEETVAIFRKWEKGLEYVGRETGLVQQATAGLVEHYERLGMVVPLEKIDAFKEDMTDLIALYKDSGRPLEEFAARLEEEVKALHQSIDAKAHVKIATEQADKATADLEATLEKMGRTMPLEQIERFRRRVENLWRDGLKAGRSVKELAAATEELGRQTTASTGFLGQLGQMLKRNLVGITAVALAYKGVMMVAQGVQKFFRETIQLAEQSIEANFRLSMAVRQHQKATSELSPTIQEAMEFSKEMAETYMINVQQAKRLYSQTLLLTREYKLSKQQTEELQESVIALSEALGKDYQQTLSAVTQAMMTGGSEALRMYGIDLDETKIRVEAIKRGLIDYGDALDDTTRAMVIADIVTEEGNRLKEDAAKAQDTWAGKIKESREKVDNLKRAIGERFIVAIANLMEALGNLAAFLENVFGSALDTADKILLSVDNYFRQRTLMAQAVEYHMKELGRALTQAELKALELETATMANAETEAIWNEALEESGKGLGILEDSAEDAGESVDEMGDKLMEAWDELREIIDKEAPKLAAKEEKIYIDLQRNLTRISERFYERRMQAARRYTDAIRDIERRAVERRGDVTRKFHLDEQRALEDHQLRMQRIEEQFLWDITDAVRERDARAVLMARRRFEQDKRREQQDYRLDKRRRQENFRIELQEIERQRQMRTALRWEEFQEKLKDLDDQEAVEREKARENAAQRLDDLHRAFFNELGLKSEFIADDIGLDDEHYRALADRMLNYWGPRGYHEQVLEYALGETAVYAAAIRSAMQGIYGYPEGGETPRPGPGETRHQRGGTVFATSPRMLLVGETPERVDITRLSAATGAVREPRATGPGGQPVQIDLLVMADDRLVIEVVDQTLDAVADVHVNIQRQAHRRLRG